FLGSAKPKEENSKKKRKCSDITLAFHWDLGEQVATHFPGIIVELTRIITHLEIEIDQLMHLMAINQMEMGRRADWIWHHEFMTRIDVNTVLDAPGQLLSLAGIAESFTRKKKEKKSADASLFKYRLLISCIFARLIRWSVIALVLFLGHLAFFLLVNEELTKGGVLQLMKN
ncbi:hypothetical protein ACJX0J_017819, partial [Zea mays]